MKPGTIDAVMPRGGSEIPNPGVAGSGEQTIANQLVASPLSNDCAGDITDVVLVETQHRAQPGIGQRLPRARQTVAVQAAKLNAFFEVDLCCARRLKRPVPSMYRLEIVFVDGKEFRF